MTLQELEKAVWQRVNLGEAPPTRDRERVRSFLNETHKQVLSKPGMRQLRNGQTQFSSTASQNEYGLNQAVSRIIHIRETTNDWTLDQRTLDWYRTHEPDTASSTGTPQVWIPLGYGALATRPDSTGLWAVSSSASDAMVVRLKAQTATQVTTDGTLTLNGTTRVQFGTATNYRDVSSFALASPAVGSISLYNASSGGTELAVIPVGRTVSRYYRLALWPTPSAAVTYLVDFEFEIQDLEHSTDEPLVPAEFHDVLWLGAVRDEYEHRDDDRYTVAATRYERRVKELQAFVYNHREAAHRQGRWSNLGPYFPADRWWW